MSNGFDPAEFAGLTAMSADEVVTHSFVSDVPLSNGRTLALLTLDNGRDHRRPNTLGPATLLEYRAVLDRLAERAAAGEIHAVAVIGKQYILAAGADLSKVEQIPDRDTGLQLARLGHAALGRLAELGVPSFAFINGLALGGGLEIALHADYRTVDSSVPAVALPEVFLGLVPGWGGAWLLPNLIGIEHALKVVIENPLKNNRTLKGAQVRELGIADAMFGPARFLEESIRWATGVLDGTIEVSRPNRPGKLERAVKWDIAIGVARKTLESRIGRIAKAPYAALELLRAAKSSDRQTGFAAEDEALATLIAGDQFRASVYAFNLVQKRAKRPVGAPDPALATPITKVGVVGAGLMARQLALLFLRRLQVPVVISDLDQERVEAAIAALHEEIDQLATEGRIGPDESNRLRALLSGTTSIDDFGDCDWVIEAVYEELGIKQQVFADLERVVRDDAILATNTSSLSVTAMAAGLRHPERVIGFHFFNPVAIMPLVEVARTQHTDETVLSTAMVTATALRKSAVIVSDSTGFVVNRVLARLLGEAMHAVDTGTSFETVEAAVAPFGLPMTPFELLELVGLTVGAHVLDAHHAAFPDRFLRSDNLHRLAEHGRILARDRKGRVTGVDRTAAGIVDGGTSPMTDEQLRVRIEDALADEIHRMLADGVVTAAEDIDLALLLGAGWPFQMGGATPYLDRVGASQRVFGATFHSPPIVGTD